MKRKLKELRVLWRMRHLNSKSWRAKRELVLERANYKCQVKSEVCLGDKFQVHHLTYDRLGKEDVERDLILACERCHEILHYPGRKN